MSFDLKRATAALDAAISEGIEEAAKHVLDVSQKQVPVDEGDLKRSGGVQRVSDSKMAVEYRDPVSVIVHENMVVQHDQGNAKYLENALNSERDEATSIVAAKVRAKLGG